MSIFLHPKTTVPIVASFFMAILASCASISDIENEPLTAGEERVYSAPADKIKNCISGAAISAGYTIAGQKNIDASTYCYTLDKAASMSSWGQIARVLVISRDKSTTVRFYNKKKNAMNVTEQLDSPRQIFFLSLDNAVK